LSAGYIYKPATPPQHPEVAVDGTWHDSDTMTTVSTDAGMTTQAQKDSTQASEEKPNAALEIDLTLTDEASNARMLESAFETSEDNTKHAGAWLEYSDERLLTLAAAKESLVIGEPIQRPKARLGWVFTYASQEHEVARSSWWQAQKTPGRRGLVQSFILLCCVVVIVSLHLLAVVAFFFRIQPILAYSCFRPSPPAVCCALGPFLAAPDFSGAGAGYLGKKTVAALYCFLLADMLYGGPAAFCGELVVWGRIIFGTFAGTPGLDEYMKMWTFSVKSLGRPRVKPGHRRIEWKCVSVVGSSNPSLTSLTVKGMRLLPIW
jgi:hypothetical protein